MGTFYGWRIVAACMLCSLIGNALGLFGAGVYLHQVVIANGWTTGVASGAVTMFYLVSALLLIPVGSGIRKFGPSPIVAISGVALAGGVVLIGRATTPWEAYFAFLSMGVGWAGLSLTAVAATLAPWFEQYQGRAVSIASLGASAGGILGAPVLLFGISQIGFAATTLMASACASVIIPALAFFALRSRPQELGLSPDGLPVSTTAAIIDTRNWTLSAALRTSSLRSVMVTFGIGMMVQIGYLAHQIALLAQSFDALTISLIVSSTAGAALVGRVGLARFADQLDARSTAAVALVVAATSFVAIAAFPIPSVLVGANVIFGLTVGNITTLSPIIVRREFGAKAFGLVFGTASCAIQLVAALGPSFYGVLHDALGSYAVALLGAAALDIFAATIVLASRKKQPHR
jgi:MFS family permease